MAILNIVPTCAGRAVDPETAQSLRMDLEREVGAIQSAGEDASNAKGGVLDIATIAVAVLSSQAVVALVGVLKSWLERERAFEIEVGGEGWNVRLKSADARAMSAFDLAGLIDRAMNGNRGEKADASGDPGRV